MLLNGQLLHSEPFGPTLRLISNTLRREERVFDRFLPIQTDFGPLSRPEQRCVPLPSKSYRPEPKTGQFGRFPEKKIHCYTPRSVTPTGICPLWCVCSPCGQPGKRQVPRGQRHHDHPVIPGGGAQALPLHTPGAFPKQREEGRTRCCTLTGTLDSNNSNRRCR